MNPTESAVHAELQTVLIYGSLVVLLALGGFIWWLNYRYRQRNKKASKPHLELVKQPHNVRRQRHHKKHKK